MKILLVGGGNTTSQLNMALTQHQHTILASFSTLTPGQLNLFDDYQAVIVIAPESSVTTDVLNSITENGKLVVVIAGTVDGIGAWATATSLPCYPYPLNDLEQNNLLEYLSRYSSGGVDKSDMYRRNNLGSDMTARIQSGMSTIRKIAITGPKGGTGKTTVAVNLAVTLALSGITTYLVDADGNVGSFWFLLRLADVSIKRTMFQLLRDVKDQKATPGSGIPFENLALSGKFLQAFTDINTLPTLKVLPGLTIDNLGADLLQDEELIDATIKGLYEAGAAAGGVVIMDVGLNPSHPMHRSALAHADAISIVIKPEVPDIAFTQHWIKLMITSLAYKSSTKIATEFIGSRVKLCYNMVFDDGLFRNVHKYLNNTLLADKSIGFSVVPNGVLPKVNDHLAFNASSSDRVEDLFMWRYKKEHAEDLVQFADSMVAFGTQFVPVLRDAAARVGLVTNGQKKKSRLSFLGNR